MITESHQFSLDREATNALVAWAREAVREADAFTASQKLVQRLGAHPVEGQAQLGFWTPQLSQAEIPPERTFLELFTAQQPINFRRDEQQLTFQRDRINLIRDGDFTWGIVNGMTPGTRNQIGTFYRLIYQDHEGKWIPIHDHLAYSIPFGAFAPAEYYDFAGMLANRRDAAHFANQLDTKPDPDGVPRVQFPGNILQIHAGYTSEEGSIAGLTRVYQRIAEKLRDEQSLDPPEENFMGYDAVQLMPIEPIIEYEAGPPFWEEVTSNDDLVVVTLRRPDMTNWGYDVVISASPAINPVLLESKRPDELLDFIETLHNFPGKPIKVMFDIVYGHIDNQGLGLLNDEYFAGANMYGQNVNFLQPMVRAILLEMMRRKHNYGVDGIRVDGAQDFKWWKSDTDEMIHDDDFLHRMNDVELDVAGVHYRPWMIFEDGRPWPRDDWELASTYREVTKLMPNVWQWGPLTFAHNTPFLFTFWTSKWWRIREMADIGREWITGCANHDTLRRGTQVPLDARINTYLGDSLPAIIEKAYDNPAAKLFDYAMMPGIPMDFVNANMRAPWGFIRNMDDRYGVKVVSEEARWMYWRVNPEHYNQPGGFPRLKALGFVELTGLRRFLDTLDHAVRATGYYLDAIVSLMRSMEPPLDGPSLSVPTLKEIARAFMDDVHDYCNITRYWESQNPQQTAYMLNLREFRRQRPWLIENLTPQENLTYIHPTEGSAIFYGNRHAPDGAEKLFFIANMEGAPRTIVPAELLPIALASEKWDVALKTPGLEVGTVNDPLTLHDSEGVVFVKT